MGSSLSLLRRALEALAVFYCGAFFYFFPFALLGLLIAAGVVSIVYRVVERD